MKTNNEMKTTKKTKELEPGNDILNGIERWLPEKGKKIPKQFEYKSPDGIWYKNKWEYSTCLARHGIPQEKWCALLKNPFPEAKSDETTP